MSSGPNATKSISKFLLLSLRGATRRGYRAQRHLPFQANAGCVLTAPWNGRCRPSSSVSADGCASFSMIREEANTINFNITTLGRRRLITVKPSWILHRAYPLLRTTPLLPHLTVSCFKTYRVTDFIHQRTFLHTRTKANSQFCQCV